MGKKGKLTGRQAAAVQYLLTMNVKDTAAAVKVTPRTLTNWMALPHFQEALSGAQRDAVSSAVCRLGSILGAAVDSLAELLDDEKPGVKLGAIRAALSEYPNLRRLVDFDERLTALEARLNGNV